jgi:transcriptional regulator GlxA family with amidase domain
MTGTQTAAIPFLVYKVEASPQGGLPQGKRFQEHDTLAVLIGTPVVLSSGVLIERTAISTSTSLIAGFTQEAAHSLTTTGTAKNLTYGSVQNQASAQLIPLGGPISDGLLGIWVANDETWFIGKTDAAHTTIITDVGSIFGLTKDSTTNYWFVDTTITTTAGGAAVQVMAVIDAATVGGRVAFKVARTFQQLYT